MKEDLEKRHASIVRLLIINKHREEKDLESL